MSRVYTSGPRKINLVSIVFVLLGVAAVYAAARFLPAYWTQWQVKEALRDACAQMYRFQRYNVEAKTEAMQKLEGHLHESLTQLGIDDPEATIELDDREPNWVVARATYSVVVNHPVGRPTVLHFTPEARMDVTPDDRRQ